MPARNIWLTCVVCACVAGPVRAQTLQFTPVAYPSATANAGRNTVALLLNKGEGGGFHPPREIPVGLGPFDIVAGDLNRDGIPDLGVTTPDARAIEVLLMGPHAQIASRYALAVAGDSRGATLADVTRDGVLDLVHSDSTPSWRMPFSLTVRDGRGGESTDAIQVTIANEPEIVLHPGADSSVHGMWTTIEDTTAASGRRLFHANANAPKVEAPLADPPGHVDVWFAADPTQTDKLWVRLKAQSNSWANDSVWLQFTGAEDSSGQPVHRVGTVGGLAVNLEECSGCGVSGWGWEDDGWGAPDRNGVLLRFPDGGGQRIRIQVREDGVSVDQIVLSAVRFKTTRPGRAKNDTVILPATQREPQ